MSLHQICPVPEFPRFRGPTDAEERSMAAALAEQAAKVEDVAKAVQARIEPADLADMMHDAGAAELLQMVRAGRLDDAGREFARLVARYCVECGEYAAGVQ